MNLIDVRLIRAQAPPSPEAMPGGEMGGPPPGGEMGTAEMGGAPPMGGDMGGMMGGGGDGGAPQTGPKERQEIGGPLDEVALILHDFNIEQKVETTGKDPSKLAQQIWVEYGGDKFGNIVPGRVGERLPEKNVSDEQIEAERDATEDSRWKRLPKGLNLAQVIMGSDDPQDQVDASEAFDALLSLCKGALYSSAQGLNPVFQKAFGAPPGPTANTKSWLKLAEIYETKNKFKSADLIDKILAIKSHVG